MKKNGIIKIGSKITNEEILIGKLKRKKEKNNITNQILSTLFNKPPIINSSFKAPKFAIGTVTKIQIIKKKNFYSISVYLIEKRKIQEGDKIAGRHGNKGVISKILNLEDMPYLQDGTPLDILLNPLGIPSRMNVGQIYECLLTLAAVNLCESYKLLPFYENNTGQISKKLVYYKLNQAKKKTGQHWLFNPNYPGKTKLFDGKTGYPFQQPILIGYSYMLKLIHLVKDKLNARLTGPYSIILKQPLRGKVRKGGQRIGEMEVWALEGFGAAFTLQELFTIKSDDVKNRAATLIAIIKGQEIPHPGTPESLKILIIELQSLLIDIKIFEKEKKSLIA